MKIYSPKDSRREPRQGYTLEILAEVTLPKEVSSVGFFGPTIPPQGRWRNHYHEDCTEFMFFSQNSQIKVGETIPRISPGDIVCLSPGKDYEIIPGPEGMVPLAIKSPSNPKDMKFL